MGVPDIDMRPIMVAAFVGYFVIFVGCGAVVGICVALPFALFTHSFGPFEPGSLIGAGLGALVSLVPFIPRR